MSFYEFKSVPQMVLEKSRGQAGSQANQKPAKYRNLMFDKHIVHGLTSKNLISLENQKISSKILPLKKQSTLKLADSKVSRFRAKELDCLIKTPRARTGYSDNGTLTEEYFEELSNTLSVQNQSCQTESLLSRALKVNNIITTKGESIGTQIEKKDYLIDFEEQTESVLRVLLNKILEESRMEVLEEIEMEKIGQQKKRANQEKLRMLNKLQRAQFKEERLNLEVQKRKFQNELAKSNNMAAYQKLCVRGFAKKLIAKAQMRTDDYVTDIRNYLDISSARIFTEFLPILNEGILEILQEKESREFLARKLVGESAEQLKDYHRFTVEKQNVLEEVNNG